MAIHGYVGLAIILIAKALLFSGNLVVGRWFTPIIWTGYVLLGDALVFRLRRRSLLRTDRIELLTMAVISIACWWLFEFYNAPRFWTSDLEIWWHYHNLEPNPFVRRVGYDWAFATIFPAMFITAQLLASTVFKKLSSFRKLHFSRLALNSLVLLGLIAAVVPLVFISPWFAPVIWLSFILLLDPVNHVRGWPSLIGDLVQGQYRRLFALLLSGGICGFLWEFWNFWALSKWTYTVPYLGNVKIFEMPVLGYLGFPFFAVECWVMYIFLRSLLSRTPIQTDGIWFESLDGRAGEIFFGTERRHEEL